MSFTVLILKLKILAEYPIPKFSEMVIAKAISDVALSKRSEFWLRRERGNENQDTS